MRNQIEAVGIVRCLIAQMCWQSIKCYEIVCSNPNTCAPLKCKPHCMQGLKAQCSFCTSSVLDTRLDKLRITTPILISNKQNKDDIVHAIKLKQIFYSVMRIIGRIWKPFSFFTHNSCNRKLGKNMNLMAIGLSCKSLYHTGLSPISAYLIQTVHRFMNSSQTSNIFQLQSRGNLPYYISL